MIDVLLGVQPLRMLLDTGATTCLISEAIAARIVRDGYGVWQGDGRFKMADGTIRTLPTLLIREVRIGRHTVRTVPAGVSSTGEMLLAFPVVNAIAPFTIDTRARVLIFHTSSNSIGGGHIAASTTAAPTISGPARVIDGDTVVVGILLAMALLLGAALVLSFLHWKEWRERGSEPVYLKKAKPLDGLLRDHPSQRKADDLRLPHQKAHKRRRILVTGILLALIAAALGAVVFANWFQCSASTPIHDDCYADHQRPRPRYRWRYCRRRGHDSSPQGRRRRRIRDSARREREGRDDQDRHPKSDLPPDRREDPSPRGRLLHHRQRHRHQSGHHRPRRGAGVPALRRALCAVRAGGRAGGAATFVLLREEEGDLSPLHPSTAAASTTMITTIATNAIASTSDIIHMVNKSMPALPRPP